MKSIYLLTIKSFKNDFQVLKKNFDKWKVSTFIKSNSKVITATIIEEYYCEKNDNNENEIILKGC